MKARKIYLTIFICWQYFLVSAQRRGGARYNGPLPEIEETVYYFFGSVFFLFLGFFILHFISDKEDTESNSLASNLGIISYILGAVFLVPTLLYLEIIFLYLYLGLGGVFLVYLIYEFIFSKTEKVSAKKNNIENFEDHYLMEAILDYIKVTNINKSKEEIYKTIINRKNREYFVQYHLKSSLDLARRKITKEEFAKNAEITLQITLHGYNLDDDIVIQEPDF